MRDIVIPTIVLFLICVIVTMSLALTNYATKDAIAEQNKIQAESAKREVFSEAETFEEIEDLDSILGAAGEEKLIKEAFHCSKNGKEIGRVYSVESNGYGGVISMVVGIDNDGKITGVKIISLSETPGLGSKVQEEPFLSQLVGITPKEALTVVKSGGSKQEEIDAVSGATISSKAVVKGIQAAIDMDKKIRELRGEAVF
ncbi:RnfABCDGE type electron transport complex subunit G [Acetivibrio clariflavus]|uniref:Ion-translocating oxidoreductase complex subunit G n=1 Tax=Acetivibrio clariflavus (strain DSM 19732 / NBRC 101661 / EBR45) TaxID=720554 RepID=G8LZG2_ACECE|nr:RnfABCDGE type electron transport complex subunit G [Acetivibrio clariflavus]AEV66825.1 electron transport complex, RnfABCDGE type, G subunit [Acetivibrio clariflavus DSM 19732]